MYGYEPSVQSAIDESFKFHTENEKSSYFKKITDISKYKIINQVRNEYYRMFSCDDEVDYGGKAYSPWNLADNGYISISKTSEQIADDGGGMHNGYDTVDNKHQPKAFWTIIYDVWNNPQTEDRNQIILYGLIPLSVLMIIPLSILLYRRSKIQAIEK